MKIQLTNNNQIICIDTEKKVYEPFTDYFWDFITNIESYTKDIVHCENPLIHTIDPKYDSIKDIVHACNLYKNYIDQTIGNIPVGNTLQTFELINVYNAEYPDNIYMKTLIQVHPYNSSQNNADDSLSFLRGCFITFIHYFISSNKIMRICPNCKNKFNAKSYSKATYCTRMFTQTQNCQEYASTHAYKNKLKNTPSIQNEYHRFYVRIKKAINNHAMSEKTLTELKSIYRKYKPLFDSNPSQEILDEFISCADKITYKKHR